MIKVSHEVPIALLEQSRGFNDYDYALVHLFEVFPEYYKFFKDSLAMGREVILDNSIFELGTAFDMDEFAKWIVKLRPTTYIVPDVLGSAAGTLENLREWNEKYAHSMPGKSMGVLQGNSYEEIVACYLIMEDWVDEIAICFHYPFYDQTDEGKMNGRISLIAKLIRGGIINKHLDHHLLGCSLPQEFAAYRHLDFIKSLDTSNPIVHGLKLIPYTLQGLPAKESVKLADLIMSKPNSEQMDCIEHNLTAFKSIIE
jgi:hypothetical protein